MITLYIFVFEDYGIATLQEGASKEETEKIAKALMDKSVAHYRLTITEGGPSPTPPKIQVA